MTPANLITYLNGLIEQRMTLSTMIWGPPGIGKSSIVAQTAAARGLAFSDVRLSQLAPTDLRGLPVAENGMARWYPPEFLPREGKGILFLDELNLAPPVIQGVAQQLVLDRHMGSYQVPEGWYIWAAGNRKEDRAAVFDMPAPLANRFLHLHVEPDMDSFRMYAWSAGLHEHIIAFLSYRPSLLHKPDPQEPAWPAPRSWEMASRLHQAGLDIRAAVGEGAAAEFDAYVYHADSLPDLDAILRGAGHETRFPHEPSVAYATVVGLAARAATAEAGHIAFRWLVEVAPAEWVQVFAADLFEVMRSRNQMGAFAGLIVGDRELQRFLGDYQRLLAPQV